MPIYEYKCSSCNKLFEVFQGITEEPLDSCPDCHGSVKKLVSMSAFHLKGGGWYADGYSSSSGGNGGDASGKSTSTATGPADKTGDKKSSSPAQSDSKSGSTPKNSPATASS